MRARKPNKTNGCSTCLNENTIKQMIFQQALYTSTLSKHFTQALYQSTLSRYYNRVYQGSTIAFIKVLQSRVSRYFYRILEVPIKHLCINFAVGVRYYEV